MTVAELKKKGAAALSDAQLKALIVGKAFWVRNNVTGDQFSQNFTTEGQTIVFRIGTNAVVPSGFGNVERDGYRGITTPYKIEGGKLITLVSQDPYAFTFYKLGNTYYAARSNEFGYANYEIIPAPQVAVNPLTEVSQSVFDRAGADGATEAADRPDPEGGAKQLGALKKDASLSAVQKVERVEEDWRLLRREAQAAAQCGAAAEVPGPARRLPAAAHRGDGIRRLAKARKAIFTGTDGSRQKSSRYEGGAMAR